MKRFFIFCTLFFCGCSNKIVLNCSSVNNDSILGSKHVDDVFIFESGEIVSFRRVIKYSLNSDVDGKFAYKALKLEGKALKKYIGGKYKISDNVNMIFSAKGFDKLNYIGIDSSYGYDDIVNSYSNLGFECK